MDATTLEANAAMRSIKRRDTGGIVRGVRAPAGGGIGHSDADASGVGAFSTGPRKDRKTSNTEWASPADPDAKIAKMKDGRTHLAHKAEHGVDLETGAILSATVQDASEGDTADVSGDADDGGGGGRGRWTRRAAGSKRWWRTRGYHSDQTLVALEEIGGSQLHFGAGAWSPSLAGQEDWGRTPAEKRAAQEALYGEPSAHSGRPGSASSNGRRGELVERPFRASVRDRGACGGCGCAAVRMCASGCSFRRAGCNLGLLLRRLAGVGTPRSLQGAGLSRRFAGLIGRLIELWGPCDGGLEAQMATGGVRRLNCSSRSCLTKLPQRTDFFHGLSGYPALPKCFMRSLPADFPRYACLTIMHLEARHLWRHRSRVRSISYSN